MKKFLMMSVLMMMPALSQAATESFYNAIKAPETDARPVNEDGDRPLGVLIAQKSVGGLTCIKRQVVYPGAKASYRCALDPKAVNADVLYKALDVEETDGRKVDENGNPALGAEIRVKTLDNLVCVASRPVVPNARFTYRCVVHF